MQISSGSDVLGNSDIRADNRTDHSSVDSGGVSQEARKRRFRAAAARAKRKQIEAELTDLIRHQIGTHAKIKFPNKIPAKTPPEGYGGKFVCEKTFAGLYRPGKQIIEIALADNRYPDIWRTALHEPFHVVQDLLATDAELKILKREDGRLREVAAKVLHLTPEQARDMSPQEVQATAYDTWASGQWRPQPQQSAITRLDQYIKKFLIRAKNSLTGLGYKTADDIFESTYSGEMSNRPARGVGRFVHEIVNPEARVWPTVTSIRVAKFRYNQE